LNLPFSKSSIVSKCFEKDLFNAQALDCDATNFAIEHSPHQQRYALTGRSLPYRLAKGRIRWAGSDP